MSCLEVRVPHLCSAERCRDSRMQTQAGQSPWSPAGDTSLGYAPGPICACSSVPVPPWSLRGGPAGKWKPPTVLSSNKSLIRSWFGTQNHLPPPQLRAERGAFSFPTTCNTSRIRHCRPITARQRIFTTISSNPFTVVPTGQEGVTYNHCKVQCQCQSLRVLVSEDCAHISELYSRERSFFFSVK